MGKVDLKIIGIEKHEIELARFGYIRLVWITSLLGYNNFEIRSWNGNVFKSVDPQIAIKKFNELTQ